ncbi:MAG: hypothetical protein ABH813_00580 [Patescibacteria group bacterium]
MDNNNKIFDILPPGKKEIQPLKNKEAVSAQRTAKKEIPRGGSGQEKTGGPALLKRIVVFVVFLLAAFALISNFVLNRAEIKIWPKTEIVNSNEKILADTAQTAIDPQAKTIPGKFFEEEKIISQEFSATGKTQEGQKASGIIRVYNNYSEASQVLIKNTRFISAEGKLFRTTEKIIVPGGTYNKGKLQPGFVDANVAADQPGEDYNIDPSTFSIPGFVGTPKYTAFYGKSSAAMSGGFVGEAWQITKEDLDKAKKILSDKSVLEGKISLKNKIPDGFVLPDEAVYSEITEATSSLLAGAKAKTFTYQVKAKLEAIAFKRSDLENLLMEIVLSGFSPAKIIQEGSLSVVYTFDSSDIKTGKLVLNTSFSSKVYSGIDENNLVQNLAGESLVRAQKILTDLPEITKVQIKSWPFWSDLVPKDSQKITIKLMLD